MTENEAKRNNSANSSYTKNIPHTETCEKCLYIKSRCKCNKSDANAGCIGINEAQEYLLNRYLVVGSPVNPPKEECEKHNAVLNIAIQALEEIKQYRAIGTIEEFKALKEKNTPYKPQEYEDRYYACKCDNILLPKWRKYPTELMPKSEGLPHCIACGQKLDWSE